MPRNACLQCRTRKVKCLVPSDNRSCKQCLTRHTRCSYTDNLEPKQRGHSYVVHQVQDAAAQADLKSDGRYALADTSCGLDIGLGTPAEILREGELTQSLLLLYFSNFSDIHFMFDQDLFMRRYALGEAPKMVLYSMMALGIRYSHAPFRDSLIQSHRGEALYQQARELLKDEFDHPSLTTAQTYVLISTYHLTFGGSRKAWIYLNNAYTIVKSLRLVEDPLEVDPLQAELSRRLIGTIMLLDRTISPSIKMKLVVPTDEAIPDICSEEQFQEIKNLTIQPTKDDSPSLIQHTILLANVLNQICSYVRYGVGDPQEARSVLQRWSDNLPETLHCTPRQLELYHQRSQIRLFVFMHILFHHIYQLTLFASLHGASIEFSDRRSCYAHAVAIVDLSSYLYKTVGFDLHNACIAQCLTIAAVIETHCLLTAADPTTIQSSQSSVLRIREHFSRVQQHTRLYAMTSGQLEMFLKICSLNTSRSPTIFNQPISLLNQMLHLGTGFERLDYRTAGRLDGLEGFLIRRDQDMYLQYMNGNASILLLPSFVEERMKYVANLQRDLHDGNCVDESDGSFNFEDYAWMFTDLPFPLANPILLE